MTELDAVNEMLNLVGAESVGSLESAHPQAMAAIEHLTRESKKLQRTGWWFNREYGTLKLLNGALDGTPVKVIVKDKGIRFRKNKFENIKTKVEEPLTTEIHYAVYTLAWDDLPETAQEVILCKAKVSFSRDELEDPAKERELTMNLVGYTVILKEEELAQTRVNAFETPRVARVLARIRPVGRRYN